MNKYGGVRFPDPETQAHFEFHREILHSVGIDLYLNNVAFNQVELSVQQTDNLDIPVSSDELHDRVTAIFRFMSYMPMVRVLPPGVLRNS